MLAAGNPDENLVAGIGDDCAVFRIGSGRLGLLTTDMSVEGAHFRSALMDPADIGFRSMAANISDIAAMNGRAMYALVSAGLPPQTGTSFIDSLFSGMIECADIFSVAVIGGDTVRAEKPVISITLYGEVSPEILLLRSGARAGDAVYMTGFTGCSAAGMNIFYSEKPARDNYPVSVARHLRPMPAVNSLPVIARFRPTAMIDISDGILSDMRRLCEESGTGFVIDCGSVPVHSELERYSASHGVDPVLSALTGGEEYELLFTAPDTSGPPAVTIDSVTITRIGRVTEKGYMLEKDGNLMPAPEGGFDHFNI